MGRVERVSMEMIERRASASAPAQLTGQDDVAQEMVDTAFGWRSSRGSKHKITKHEYYKLLSR